MLLDAAVVGLTAGSLYGLVAVGLNILYRPTKVFNFAQGALVMLGAVASALLTVRLGWHWAVALAAVVLALAALALLEERVAAAPPLARGAGATGWIISTLACALIITHLAAKLLGADAIVSPAPAPLSTVALPLKWIRISSWQITVVLVSVLLVAGVEGLYRSRWSKAALALAEDRDAALLRGIDPAAVSRWAWALGGALAGLTGVLAAPVLNLSAALGAALLLKGFAAAAIGGLGSNRGALLAGWAIGLVEAYAALWFSPGYHNAVLLVVVLGILMLRPGAMASSEARSA